MRFGVFAFLIIAFPVHADDLLEKILRRLGEPGVVRAQFVQERLITDMTRPTLSRGRIAVSRRDGLLWRIESPVTLTLAFTPIAIIETGGDGVRRLRAQGRGIDTQIGRVLRGILGADEQSLRESFEPAATGSPEKWAIRLAPRPREMARMVREIRLAGGRYLESIEVEETSGNQTTIRLRAHSIDQALDATELEFFKAP